MSNPDPASPLFDVVIYRIHDRVVTSVWSRGERMRCGFTNAEKHLELALIGILENNDAEIVRAGKFRVGDTLPHNIREITSDLDTDEH